MPEDPAKHEFSPVAPDLPAGSRWRACASAWWSIARAWSGRNSSGRRRRACRRASPPSVRRGRYIWILQ